MDNWRVSATHEPSNHRRHMAGFATREADAFGSAAHYPVVDPGPDPLYRMLWARGNVELRSTDVLGSSPLDVTRRRPAGWEDRRIHNNDPFSHCTTGPDDVTMCVRMSWEETRP
jgi:hypothetical protein